MKNLKKLTLLHSNDMHGDFFAQKADDNLIGGVSLLSGYIQNVRKGMKVEDAVSKIKGIKCGMKSTSCPDQLAIALEEAVNS